MQLEHELNPSRSVPRTRRPPPPSRPGLARLLVAGLLAAAAVVAATLAIGTGGSSASPTILNTEKVEQAIERASLAERGLHADVSCPAGVQQQKGLVFACTAVVKGVGTRFAITELDDAGHVHFEAR